MVCTVRSSLLEESPYDLGLKICVYVRHAEPYCGKDTNLPETGLWQGSGVGLGMIEKCEKCNVSLHPEAMKPYHQ